MKLVIKDNSSYSADRLTLYPFDDLYEDEDGKLRVRDNIVVPVGEHEIVKRIMRGHHYGCDLEWATITIDGVVYGKWIDDPDVKKLIQGAV